MARNRGSAAGARKTTTATDKSTPCARARMVRAIAGTAPTPFLYEAGKGSASNHAPLGWLQSGTPEGSTPAKLVRPSETSADDVACLDHRLVPECRGESMRRRRWPSWLRLVVASLVVALGSGSGLPGLVRALAPPVGHVCTCASGGSHGSCPVCNGSHLATPSRLCALRGVPCGEDRLGLGVGCELGVLPGAGEDPRPAFERAGPACQADLAPELAFVEPATPPPRLALG
jgi:hypothetical protein